jgi:hypothetical protein
VDIRLLYVEGCPHWRLAGQQLREALARAGAPDAAVTCQLVRTPEEAARTGFRGSPTIIIDGADPFARPGDPVGLTCRIYRTAAGTGPTPTVEQLQQVLADAAGRRSLWGWSPPPLPADTPLKRRIDRLLPATGMPLLLYFAVIVALLMLAPVLPRRGELAADGLAALAAGSWCGLNFWRCRHAHCLITSAGWLGLSVLAFAEAGLGHSLIGGDEQLVFIGLLILAVAFEVLWYLRRGTNAVTPARTTQKIPANTAPAPQTAAFWEDVRRIWNMLAIRRAGNP